MDGLSRADYEAQYTDGDWLRGSLTWQVEHAAAAPSLLAITPLNIALGEARWRDGGQLADFGGIEQDRAAPSSTALAN